MSRNSASASLSRSAAVDRAVELVDETIAELRGPCRVRTRGDGVHELSLSGAIVNTVVKHAEGRRVTVVSLRVGSLRQVVPDTLEFYFEFVARGTVCEGARLEQELVPASLRCDACAHEWAIDDPGRSGARSCGTGDVDGGERRRVRGGVDRGRGGRVHRTKVKIVEEALDANNTIARANRDDFDRAGVTVVNFMSAPGRG